MSAPGGHLQQSRDYKTSDEVSMHRCKSDEQRWQHSLRPCQGPKQNDGVFHHLVHTRE